MYNTFKAHILQYYSKALLKMKVERADIEDEKDAIFNLI